MENKISYMSRNLAMEIESRVNTSRGELLAEEGDSCLQRKIDVVTNVTHIFELHFLIRTILLFRTRLSGTH